MKGCSSRCSSERQGQNARGVLESSQTSTKELFATALQL